VTIGKQIRVARLMRGLSQAQFADLVGIAQEMINRYERGICAPTHHIHAKIDAVLNSPRVTRGPVPALPGEPRIFFAPAHRALLDH
jgi:transcriptional regulator with XRE-family HTH domain